MKQLLVLLIPIFSFLSFQQTKYVKTKVSDDISLLLPADFMPLSDAERIQKYVSSKPPIAVYTDYSRNVDLGINVAYSRWKAEDMKIMMSFYKSNITSFYDDVQFITEDLVDINGKEFAVFEFVASVSDEEGTVQGSPTISKYIRIQYTIVNGQTVLFNFACPARIQSNWAPVAKHILESVKIRKTL